jgi:transcriptional regulator with XRE-family HTH domain
MSQLDLALEAGVSPRHLSFVETGRSRPGRELLLHLAECLDVPLRERNVLFLAGGYAPIYTQTPFDADEMKPVREAVDMVLKSHEPFPAITVTSHWDLISANGTAMALFMEGVSPELLKPPVNVQRLSVHPDGLAPRIVNLGEVRAHEFARLRRQVSMTGNQELRALLEELRAYPCDQPEPDIEFPGPGEVFIPLRIRQNDQELAFFTTLSTFGTPQDITVAELIIESFFPANQKTATLLATAWGNALSGNHSL